jgi:hypothetical protein
LLLQSRPACDAQIFFHLLEATESVIDNQFFNIEVRVGDIVSVLLSIALQDKYHDQTNEEAILNLKAKNALIIGKLLSHNRQDMKNDCTNILLKNVFEKSSPLKVYGCISAISQFGPLMTQRAIMPNIEQIMT